jgi:hypothetical protein
MKTLLFLLLTAVALTVTGCASDHDGSTHDMNNANYMPETPANGASGNGGPANPGR